MRLKVFPTSVECSHSFLPAFTSSVPRSFITLKMAEIHHLVSHNSLPNSIVWKNLSKSKKFNKIQRNRPVRRSCSSNFNELFHEDPFKPDIVEIGGSRLKKAQCAISKKNPFTNQDSFSHSRCDFLEPMMLGIKPEFPDRPDQESAIWATIEQKAKSLEIPLSLRMIKKKLQLEEKFIDSKELSDCSVGVAFASMVSIIVELQSHALEMREALCREDLEIIIAKVQKEMQSSFVWLFQQVFSRTPDLMLHVMILLADFSVYSISTEEKHIQHIPQISSSVSGLEKTEITDLPSSGHYPGDEFWSTMEMNLWNSVVDEAMDMRGFEGIGLDHDAMLNFVSPISVEIEHDGYEDFLRTDLLYQMNLALEPNNPLLLCNYAQLLYLVAQDYNRAEECFKKAVQVLPPDAEALNQYANFLWTIKKDFWGAEERFLQALAAEPDNSYYASRYANFLWSTGGEETCYPLTNP